MHAIIMHTLFHVHNDIWIMHYGMHAICSIMQTGIGVSIIERIACAKKWVHRFRSTLLPALCIIACICNASLMLFCLGIHRYRYPVYREMRFYLCMHPMRWEMCSWNQCEERKKAITFKGHHFQKSSLSKQAINYSPLQHARIKLIISAKGSKNAFLNIFLLNMNIKFLHFCRSPEPS